MVGWAIGNSGPRPRTMAVQKHRGLGGSGWLSKDLPVKSRRRAGVWTMATVNPIVGCVGAETGLES